jgi:hypothetical protein
MICEIILRADSRPCCQIQRGLRLLEKILEGDRFGIDFLLRLRL